MRGARLTSVKTLAIVCTAATAPRRLAHLGSVPRDSFLKPPLGARPAPPCMNIPDPKCACSGWTLVLEKHSGRSFWERGSTAGPTTSRTHRFFVVYCSGGVGTPPPGFAHAAGGSPFLESSWRSTSSISTLIVASIVAQLRWCCIDAVLRWCSILIYFFLVAGPFTQNN